MRKLFLLSVLTTLSIAIMAQNVTLQEAEMVAKQFMQSQNKSFLGMAKTIQKNDQALLYVFNADNSFVVVSGDKRVPPILAFSDHQLYRDGEIAAPAQMWLDYYQAELSALKNQSSTSTEVRPEWIRLLSAKSDMRNGNGVQPLMQSHWGQGEYYNYYCPRDFAGENNRVVTGCVATAMSQLIYYFRFPETGLGTYSYLDSTYGVQSADYENTTYNYDAMCDEPTAINTEISKLIYHFGVGVDMVYGPDGSGMYNHSAANVLKTYFKYSPETQYLFRDSTDLDWDSVIVAHLERNIPLYYAGWSEPNINGHGFICDGYKMIDNNYYFHFNFGWDGSSDGYFYTNQLNLAGTHFNMAQELIINAYPDTNLYAYPAVHPITGTKTLTEPAGSFTDGSLAWEPYASNMDYQWVIAPNLANMNDISLNVDFDVAAGDTLAISIDNNATPSYIFTDTTGNLIFYGNHTSLTVHLRTNGDTLCGKGIRVCYNASAPSFCQGNIAHTNESGEITDGSGDMDYNNLTSCVHRIVLLGGYASVSLHVNYLKLEENKDFLRIYKNSLSDDNLLATLTGSMEDTLMEYDAYRLCLLFETDEQNNDEGFSISYIGSKTGIEDFDHDMAIFPNPAKDIVMLQNDLPIQSILVRDMLGRDVKRIDVNAVQASFSVSDMPSGVYMLQIQTDTKNIHKKLIVKR